VSRPLAKLESFISYHQTFIKCLCQTGTLQSSQLRGAERQVGNQQTSTRLTCLWEAQAEGTEKSGKKRVREGFPVKAAYKLSLESPERMSLAEAFKTCH
jgi:hypothetical protein